MLATYCDGSNTASSAVELYEKLQQKFAFMLRRGDIAAPTPAEYHDRLVSAASEWRVRQKDLRRTALRGGTPTPTSVERARLSTIARAHHVTEADLGRHIQATSRKKP